MTHPTTSRPVCGCGRPAAAGYLCTACSKQLDVDLARLAWMLPELVTLLTRQANTHRPAAPTRRRPAGETVTAEQTAIEAAAARTLSKSERAVTLVPHPIPFDQAASGMLAEARSTLVETCRVYGTDFRGLIGTP